MEERKYTEDGLQLVDPLELIRGRPDMFLPSGQLRGIKLAVQLAEEVAIVTTGAIGLMRSGLWWIVACEEDWVERCRGTGSVEHYFENMIPFPEYGVNSMHAEVVIRAFAKGLLTCRSGGDCISLIGRPPAEYLSTRVTRSLPLWRRFVAFHVEERPAPAAPPSP